MRTRTIPVGVLLLTLLSGTALAQVLYTLDQATDELVWVDTEGNTIVVGPVGLDVRFPALAYFDGTLYMKDNLPIGNGSFWIDLTSLDMCTGEALTTTRVKQGGVDIAVVNAAAEGFAAESDSLILAVTDGIMTTSSNVLWKLSTAGELTEPVGFSVFGADMDSLAVSPAGEIIALDFVSPSFNNLYEVSRPPAYVLLGTSTDGGFSEDLTFTDTGRLFGSGVSALREIDPTDGSLISAVPLGRALRGMAFAALDDLDDNGIPDVCDEDGDGFVPPIDCNDSDASVNPGAVEVGCDGIDNDCDPATLDSEPELCDGQDNDCNGLVDELNPGGGAVCATGFLGVCADGTLFCDAGSFTCLPDTAAGPELCNGFDDDCDGVVDEPADVDGDDVDNCVDNCPDAYNPPADCDGMPATPDEQCDLDFDGIGDECDCTPEPTAVGDTLRVLSTATLSWDAVPGVSEYHVYRGYGTQGNPFGFDVHQCMAPNVTATTANEPLEPRAFTLFYYMVTSKCPVGETESSFGEDSAMAPRPQPFVCPDPTMDVDGDGTDEALDNCPGFFNGSQSDVDSDSHGDACDNCPADSNPLQDDLDGDLDGDVCDPDVDGDGILDDGDLDGTPGNNPCTGGATASCDDNCSDIQNPGQEDDDADGIGNVCE